VTPVRLYLDEDAQEESLVLALRNADVDVITTLEVDRLGCTDEQQLIWATEQGRIIYSFNVGDFCRLHSIVFKPAKAGFVCVAPGL
jgi:Domain of unknown function (DUF5615)